MREFHSLLSFSENLAKIAIAEDLFVRRAVNHCAKLVKKEAKREIGTYQDEIGPFIAWPELQDATKRDREKQGFTEDDPLFRTGAMRDSIDYAMSLDGLEAQIGSNDPNAVYQELGTEHIPPRSFLGGAMARKQEEIHKTLGAAVATALVGEKVFGGAMAIEDDHV